MFWIKLFGVLQAGQVGGGVGFVTGDVACVVGCLAVLELGHAGLALLEVVARLVRLGVEAEVDGDYLTVGVVQLGLSE